MPPEVEGGAAPQAEDLASALGEAFDAAEGEAAAEASPEEAEPDTDLDIEGGEELGAEGEPEEGEPGGDPEAVTPPEHWSQEDKDRFDGLPDDAKAWWLDKTKSLESGYNSKFQEVAEQRKRFSSLEPVLEDLGKVAEQIALLGTNESDYLRTLMAADRYLRTDPQAAFKWLAENFNVDLSQFGVQPESEDPEILDPTAQAKIATLENELSSIKKQLTGQQQAEQTARQSQAQATIANFRNETDEAGNLAHPHFEKVEGHMKALLMAGAAPDLQSAYDQALWANPDLRGDLVARQTAEAAKAAAEKRKADNAKAKKASRNVKGDGMGKAKQEPADTWKGELERQMDEAGF